jgi:uncharacterized membrane protein YhaH (DUF805 family)
LPVLAWSTRRRIAEFQKKSLAKIGGPHPTAGLFPRESYSPLPLVPTTVTMTVMPPTAMIAMMIIAVMIIAVMVIAVMVIVRRGRHRREHAEEQT